MVKRRRKIGSWRNAGFGWVGEDPDLHIQHVTTTWRSGAWWIEADSSGETWIAYEVEDRISAGGWRGLFPWRAPPPTRTSDSLPSTRHSPPSPPLPGSLPAISAPPHVVRYLLSRLPNSQFSAFSSYLFIDVLETYRSPSWLVYRWLLFGRKKTIILVNAI